MQTNKNLPKNDNELWNPLGLRVREGKTDLLLMDNACLCLLSSKLHSAIMIFAFSLIAFQIYATDIATQCPLIGGPAVYLARPIVELFDENIIYNDQAVCISQGVIMKVKNQAKVENVVTTVKVYPNPAKDEINFDFGSEIFTKFIIYDSYGKVINVQLIQNKSDYKYQTTDIANGIYRYVLQGTSVDITGKIIILK